MKGKMLSWSFQITVVIVLYIHHLVTVLTCLITIRTMKLHQCSPYSNTLTTSVCLLLKIGHVPVHTLPGPFKSAQCVLGSLLWGTHKCWYNCLWNIKSLRALSGTQWQMRSPHWKLKLVVGKTVSCFPLNQQIFILFIFKKKSGK